MTTTRRTWLLGSCLSALATGVWAAGADLPTVSTRNQATANANAAEANDASTLFYNPAGIARLKGRQFSSSLSVVNLMGRVSDNGTQRSQSIGDAPGTGPEMSDPTVPQRPVDTENDDFLPAFVAGGAFFMSAPIDDSKTFGLAVFSPGGGIINYDKQWFGRYHGIRGDLLTLNINPSLAIRFDDKHSIGVGVSGLVGHTVLEIDVDTYQTGPYLINAALEKFDLNVDLLEDLLPISLPTGQTYASLPDPLKATLSENAAHLLVDPNSRGGAKARMLGFGAGWNVGYLYEFSEHTRFSLAYRSRSDIKFRGKIDWQTQQLYTTANLGVPNPEVGGGELLISGAELLSNYTRPDADGDTTLIIPAKLTAGLFHQLTPRIDLMADYVFTDSSVVKDLVINVHDEKDVNGKRVTQGPFINSVNWRDSFSVALGMNYHWSDELTLKTGVMFDKTPLAGPESRTPLVPDNDRLLFSLGGSWKATPERTIDFAYSYFKILDAEADFHQSCAGTFYEREDGSLGGLDECTGNAGNYRAKYRGVGAHILGLQLNQRF